MTCLSHFEFVSTLLLFDLAECTLGLCIELEGGGVVDELATVRSFCKLAFAFVDVCVRFLVI